MGHQGPTAGRIGFIGLGAMGGNMARRLASLGFTVSGYDPSAASAKRSGDAGVKIVDSPAAAADGADFVLSSVPDPAAIRRSYLGRDGVLTRVRTGMILIDLSRDIEHKMQVLPNHPQVIITSFATHDEVPRSALVVLTSDRGLAGGYNAGVLRAALAHLDEQQARGIETKRTWIKVYHSPRNQPFSVLASWSHRKLLQ